MQHPWLQTTRCQWHHSSQLRQPNMSPDTAKCPQGTGENHPLSQTTDSDSNPPKVTEPKETGILSYQHPSVKSLSNSIYCIYILGIHSASKIQPMSVVLAIDKTQGQVLLCIREQKGMGLFLFSRARTSVIPILIFAPSSGLPSIT